MISIYFDESGNTGSIKKRGSYDSQPYFAYSAYTVKNEDKLNILALCQVRGMEKNRK